MEEEKSLLQLLFLKDDKNQSVEVEEVEEVEELDFAKIMCRLNHGESVFISRKRKPKAKLARSKQGARFLGTHLQAKISPFSPF
ncbi:MAG: hypothetical protein OEZ18_03600 [Candidatus Bathyarchaeota archaeon]|nr:hypothetical protein [Candidatus Bathyarchaeota archaeon]